jgi:processive 1,2-diacylglycerol beta-glucosyltransferase
MTTSVLVVSASVGAGHDGAARELTKRLEAKGIRTKTVDFLDAAPRIGPLIKAVYEFQLRVAPWSYEALYRVCYLGWILCAPLGFLLAAVFGRQLRRWATELGASAVVSTYPLSSVTLGRLRTRRWRPLDIPAITFITDFAVHPMWVHPGIDLNLCVHPDSAATAHQATGRPATAPGPMVAQAFRSDLPSRAAVRQEMGISADARVALVVAGSWGVGELEETFAALARCGDWFPVAVCGQNEALRQRLEVLGTGRVFGWTDKMPQLMVASDVLLQNAGGLTCMEAFAVGLPVVTFRPIPGHGRQNAINMDSAGVAVFATDTASLRDALERATDPAGEMVRLGRAMFCGDAADEVREVAVLSAPIPLPVPQSLPRRLALAGVAAVTLYTSLNLVGDAANAAGIDAVRPPANSRSVYPFVRLGAQALSDPTLPALLAKDHFSAVVNGGLAAAYPTAVSQLAQDGVPVVNGGDRVPTNLDVFTVGNNVTGAADLITDDTGLAPQLYAPGAVVNDSDLIFAAAAHERIVRSRLLAIDKAAKLTAGGIFMVDGTNASGPQLEAWLNTLHTAIAGEHLTSSYLTSSYAPPTSSPAE